MKIIETKTVTIPEYPGSEIVMYTKPTWGSYRKVKKDMTEQEMASIILPPAIVSWNFNDQDDNPLPINEDSISRMPLDLVVAMLNEISQPDVLKKKTSEESPQSQKGSK